MKNVLIISVALLSIFKCYGQTKTVTGPLTYGPVPYRTLEQTIGEDYIVLKQNGTEKKYGFSWIKKADDDDFPYLKDSTLVGKTLKLVQIDKNRTAQLIDGSSVRYRCKLVEDRYGDIAPLYDVSEAKKKFFQKTLWYNHDWIKSIPNVTNNKNALKNLRFEPMRVIDVEFSDLSDCPVRFILETFTGEKGYMDVDVSGTNTDRKFIFERFFFEQDPKLLYNFTPQEWHCIKAGLPQIGMSTQAVRLCLGPPNDINRTVAGKNVTEQYVYGFNKFSYYYFTNGKLTTIQN